MSETSRRHKTGRLWEAEIRRLEEINTCPFPATEKTRAGEGVVSIIMYMFVCVNIMQVIRNVLDKCYTGHEYYITL